MSGRVCHVTPIAPMSIFVILSLMLVKIPEAISDVIFKYTYVPDSGAHVVLAMLIIRFESLQVVTSMTGKKQG